MKICLSFLLLVENFLYEAQEKEELSEGEAEVKAVLGKLTCTLCEAFFPTSA